MHRYLLPKHEYFDTIEKILITNNIIDSSSITTHLQSPFNLELLKQRDAKFYTSDFCFYIDSICLDTIRISKVVRHLNFQYYPITDYQKYPFIKKIEKHIGNKYFNLKSALLLEWKFFYNGFEEGTYFRDSPNVLLKPFYIKAEIDGLSNFIFQDIEIDEKQNQWIKVKFDCNCYFENEKDIGYTQKQIVVECWTLMKNFQIGSTCSPF